MTRKIGSFDHDGFNLWVFPVLALLLVAYVAYQYREPLNDPRSITYEYLQGARHGNIGYGLEGNYDNKVSFAGLEPGDIIVGGYPQCAYGRFSHAGIYIGDGQVIESYVDLGVTIQPVEHYWTYSEVSLLRIKASPEQKAQAVKYARDQLGDLFYPVAFKSGERIWNCSKFVWQAYMQQGIDLEAGEDIWLSPDSFYQSRWAEIIREKSV